MWVRAAVVIQQYNTIRELSYFVLYVLLFIKYVLVLIISEPCLKVLSLGLGGWRGVGGVRESLGLAGIGSELVEDVA